MMEIQFEYLKITRDNIIEMISDHSLGQINHIPEGYNNNLAWNFGHVIITQQLLCYKLGGETPLVSNELIELYRKGTKPENHISQAELDNLVQLSDHTIHQTIRDLDDGKFKNYKEYTTSFGVTLTSIQEAISFNNMHEAMHLGFMIALKKHL